MEIYRGAVVVCSNCPATKVFHINTSFVAIRNKLKGWNWIIGEYDNQWCSEACQQTSQRDCEHDKEYIVKEDMSSVCKNCEKDFGGIIEE